MRSYPRPCKKRCWTLLRVTLQVQYVEIPRADGVGSRTHMCLCAREAPTFVTCHRVGAENRPIARWLGASSLAASPHLGASPFAGRPHISADHFKRVGCWFSIRVSLVPLRAVLHALTNRCESRHFPRRERSRIACIAKLPLLTHLVQSLLQFYNEPIRVEPR